MFLSIQVLNGRFIDFDYKYIKNYSINTEYRTFHSNLHEENTNTYRRSCSLREYTGI